MRTYSVKRREAQVEAGDRVLAHRVWDRAGTLLWVAWHTTRRLSGECSPAAWPEVAAGMRARGATVVLDWDK